MTDKEKMAIAIEEAKLAAHEGEIPVGAAVFLGDRLVGKGHNTREKGIDISGHAEIEALKEAGRTLGRWNLADCDLYVTLEPCLMCAGAILQAGIRCLVFGAADAKGGAVISAFHVYDDQSFHPPIVTAGIEAETCEDLLKDFFQKLRK